MQGTTIALSTVLIGVLATASQAVNATVAPGDTVLGELQSADFDALSFFVGSPATLAVKAKLGVGRRSPRRERP